MMLTVRTLAVFFLTVCVAVGAHAGTVMFDDKATFASSTGAVSAGDIPHSPSAVEFSVGILSIKNALATTVNANLNFSTLIDEDFDLGLNGPENFDVLVDRPAFAFGFDFHESSLTTPPYNSFPDTCNTPVCIDSVFQINLFFDANLVGVEQFSRDDDVLTFVGISSTAAFNRIEIREIVGNSDNEFFGNFMIAAPVPAPATILLLMLGMLAIARRNQCRLLLKDC